jgi:hypothetical protein
MRTFLFFPLRIIGVLTLLPFVALFATEPEYVSSPDGVQPRKSAAVAGVAKDGEAKMDVMVHPTASEDTRTAAAEVAARLSQMIGSAVQVVEGDGDRGIVIGSLEQFPDGEIAEALKPFGGLKWVDGLPIATDTGEDGIRKWGAVEAFAIRSEPERVRLIGNTERGAYLAASRFLELLGVRQFTMSRNWLIVPEKSDVLFDAEEEQAPSFYVRDIWFSHGTPNPQLEDDPMGDRDRWRFYSRWGGAFRTTNHHMYRAVRIRFAEELEANKERFYAKLPIATPKNPWPHPGKFNLSEPRVREMITETVLDGFTARDGEPRFMSSAEPSDGANWCIRPESEAMGSISDRAFFVANEVARAAAEKYPHRMVGHLAYFMHADPPSFDLEPNLFVDLGTRMDHGSYPIEDLLEIWATKAPNAGIRDYLSTFVWGQDRIRDPEAYAPAASAPGLAELFRKYYDLGYRYFRGESALNFAIYGPGYYTGFRTLWDTSSDEMALMEDYLEKAFGPAKEPMRKFYELMDPNSGRLTHRNFYARLVQYLDEATTAAAGNAPVLTRLDELKNFMVMEYLLYRFGLVAGDEEAEKELQFQVLEQVYRNRHAYTNHYTAYRNIVQRMARKYNEPSWSEGRLREDAAWQQKEPPTPEETAELFAEVRQYFAPVPVQEVDFGSEVQVVPLSRDITESADGAEALEIGGSPRGRSTVYLYSTDGEPLRMGVHFPVSRAERHPVMHTRIWVRDAEGNLIHREAREQKQGETLSYELEVPIPGPGEYFVEASERGVSFQPGGTAIPFHRNLNNVTGDTDRLFYVPKDVEELWIYPANDGEITFVSPDGSSVNFERDDTRLARVEIPEAWRGKIWSTRESSNFHLLNAPTLFFYDAGRAVLPATLSVSPGD